MNKYCLLIYYLLLYFIAVMAIKGVIINYKRTLQATLFVFCIILAFRDPNKIQDANVYIDFLSNLKKGKNGELLVGYGYFEPGFIITSQIIKMLFGNNYQIYFFIMAIVPFMIIMLGFLELYNNDIVAENKAEAKYKYLIVCFSLYASYYGIYYNGIVIRQAFALSLVVLGCAYLNKKKYFISIIILLAAFQFHISSLVGIVLYIVFLSKSKIDKNFIFFLVLLLAIIYFNKISILSVVQNIDYTGHILNRYFNYVNRINDIATISFKYIVYDLLILYLSYVTKTKRSMINTNGRIINVLAFGLFILSIFSSVSYLTRIIDYFQVFYIPIMSKILLEKINRDDSAIIVGAIMIINIVQIFRIIF